MDITDLIRDAGSLPASALLVVKLKKLLDDANSSPEQIVQCVEAEPNIAVQVIRIANSVHYAGGLKCSDIREAITRVGYNEMYRMVGALIANELYLTDVSVYGYEEGELWESSIRVAASMRALASCIPEDEGVGPDTAYTIGLMHNIGILLINNYHMLSGIPGYVEGSEVLNADIEQECLGFTNPEVASTLLATLGLSGNVCVPVRQQLNPFESDEYVVTSSLLFACMHANEYEQAEPDDPYSDYDLPDEILEHLTISSTDVMDAVIDRGSELTKMIVSI